MPQLQLCHCEGARRGHCNSSEWRQHWDTLQGRAADALTEHQETAGEPISRGGRLKPERHDGTEFEFIQHNQAECVWLEAGKGAIKQICSVAAAAAAAAERGVSQLHSLQEAAGG